MRLWRQFDKSATAPALYAWELRRQARQRDAPLARGWGILLILMVIVGFAGAFVLVIASAPLVIPAVGVLLYSLWLQWRVLLAASGGLLQEKRGERWDTLLMTGIDADVLVRSGWWATIDLRRDAYLTLFLLRFGLLMLGIAVLAAFSLLSFTDALCGGLLVGLVLAAGCLWLFTRANLYFTAAAGVMAGMLTFSPALNFALGLILRTAALLLASALIFVVFTVLLRPYLFDVSGTNGGAFDTIGLAAYDLLTMGLAVTLLDNGTLLSAGLVAIMLVNVPVIVLVGASIGAALLLAAALYALFTWAFLRLAARLLRQRGAL